MPRISELDSPASLSGLELVPMLQGGGEDSGFAAPIFAIAALPNGVVAAMRRRMSADLTSTAPASPPAGAVRWNHVDPGAATQLFISDVDADGGSLSAALAAIGVGGFVYLQGAAEDAGESGEIRDNLQAWLITGVSVGTGFVTITGEIVAASGSMASIDAVELSLQAPGARIPTGGATGQVLAKVDGGDFNTQWVDQTGGGGGIASVVAGPGISVDNSDPANPVVSATGGGGGDGSVGLHSVPIMAGAIQPSASGGSGAVTSTASGSNLPDIVGLAFSATVRQNAQFAIPMPKSWNEGTITARFLWRHPSTSTNFGVRWGIQAVGVGDGDAIGSAYGTAQEVSDVGGATNALYRTDVTLPMTVGGSPQPEDVVYFRVYRDPLHVDDNMAVVATLIGVVLYMTTDAGTDA